MKILILVNWHVINSKNILIDIQPPDYQTDEVPYWFFKYWPIAAKVDVKGISRNWFTEKVEKRIFKFYILQTLGVLFKINQYDLIISHGAQSGIFLAFIRRVFKLKNPKHILIDIGSFNSAKEIGIVHQLMRWVSKSIDGIIYHTSSQYTYYQKRFPWLISKSQFIPFGTDADFFSENIQTSSENSILSIGYSKRDWNTLIKAFNKIETNTYTLKIIGQTDLKIDNSSIKLMPYVPINQLKSEIERCKFVVIPLEYYNYSYGQMTVLQAMSMGKAVIVAKVPSMQDYVVDNETGIFYKSGDVKNLTEKMELLIKDASLREKIAQKAKNSILNEFNENIMTKRIYDFVKNI